MAELLTSTVELQKVPDFESYTISKGLDGRYSVLCTTRVALKTPEGEKVTDLEPVSFGLSHEQIMADPNFPAVYAAIRSSHRAGLAAVRPDLVTP